MSQPNTETRPGGKAAKTAEMTGINSKSWQAVMDEVLRKAGLPESSGKEGGVKRN